MILANGAARYALAQDVTRRVRYLRGSRALYFGLLLCALLAGARPSTAQNSKPAPVSPQPLKSQLPADFKVPLLTEGLKLADFAGMAPRPDLKDKLSKVSGFVQNTPSDGDPATQQTDVWVGHTKSTLYFVFI